MSQQVAIYLQDAHTIREGMEFAKYAEEKGFDAVWQAESRLVRESTVPMAAFASVTETIKVGSGVADVWSRNPAGSPRHSPHLMTSHRVVSFLDLVPGGIRSLPPLASIAPNRSG